MKAATLKWCKVPLPTGVVARAALIALMIAGALGSTGCPSFSTMQTPRTVPKGKFRESLGAQFVRMKLSDGNTLTFPNPEVGVRYGVTDSLDIGAKFSIFTYFNAEAGFKLMLARAPLDVAVAPAISFFSLGSNDSKFTFMHLHLPLLMGVDLGESVVLGFGPKYLYSYMSGSASDSSNRFVMSGSMVGGYVNLPVEIGTGLWVAPEINAYTAVRDFGGFATLQFGLSFFFGGHEYYRDPPLPPPPPPPPGGAGPAGYYPPPPPVASPYGAPPPGAYPPPGYYQPPPAGYPPQQPQYGAPAPYGAPPPAPAPAPAAPPPAPAP